MTEGDRTTVHVHLGHQLVAADTVHVGPTEHHAGERLVDLDDVDVLHGHAGVGQHLFGGLHGSVEVVVGLGTHQALGHDARAGTQSFGAGAILVHPENGGGAVADLAAVAGGVDAVGQHRVQRRQLLGGGLAQASVAGDDDGVAVGIDDFHRDDLALEATFLGGANGLLLRDEAQVIDVGARDAPTSGDALGGAELIGHVEREVGGLGTAVQEGDVGALTETRNVGTQPHLAHVLDSTGHARIDDPGRDHVVDHVVRLLAGTALAVDGGGGHLPR